jgi:hypothetical protein
MAHLLHIDSSIQGDRSASRKLTARAAHARRAAHPGGTVTYRDLGSNPLPHFDAATGLARLVPPEQVARPDATPAYARSISGWTPAARAIKQPADCSTTCSSSAVLPTPGSPRTTNTLLSPARTVAISRSSDSHSLSRPTNSVTRPPLSE